MADAEQMWHYVRTWIMSGMTNPPEREFRNAMSAVKNEILQQLIPRCDLLIENFIHTQGSSAPGIPIVQKARAIIIESMS